MLRTMFGYSENNVTLSTADVALRVKMKVIKNNIGTDSFAQAVPAAHLTASPPGLEGCNSLCQYMKY